MVRRPVSLWILVGTLWAACLGLPRLGFGAEAWWETALRITGVAKTPSQLRGGMEEAPGDVWVMTLAQSTHQQLTSGGGYRSPIFLPGNAGLLALKGEAIMHLPRTGGAPTVRHTVTGVQKLVGVQRHHGDTVLILLRRETQPMAVGLLSLRSGAVKLLSVGHSAEDQRRYYHLRGWERVYGETVLFVQHQSTNEHGRRGTWTDVYYKRGNQAATNLSQCAASHSLCGQPSLSADGEMVAYIKTVH